MRPPGLLHLNITLKHFGRSLFGHQVQMVAKSNECQWYQSPCHRIAPSPSPSAPQPSPPLWQWPEFMPPIIPFWHMYKHTWLHTYECVQACVHRCMDMCVVAGLYECAWVCVCGVLCLLSTLGTVCTAAKGATQQHLRNGHTYAERSIQISFYTHFNINNCVFTLIFM